MMKNTRYIFSFILLAASMCWTGCEMFASHTNPIAGWKGGTTAYQGVKLDKAITDDYKDYIQKLPPEDRNAVADFNIQFYEDGFGQRAVEISMPLDGTWWKHVLIYDKNGQRIKVVKYVSGHYAC